MKRKFLIIFAFILIVSALPIFALLSLVSNSAVFSEKIDTCNTQITNETISTILSRRSVRLFKEDAISSDTLNILIKAAMSAPTGLDKRPWEFIVIDNKEDVYKYYEATGNERFKTAPAAIIICGNEEVSSLWYIDCACAAENLLLVAHSMGLGAVFTAGYPIEERINGIKTFFNLPENIVPLCAIPIGYPSGDNQVKDKYDTNKIHINAWQAKK